MAHGAFIQMPLTIFQSKAVSVFTQLCQRFGRKTKVTGKTLPSRAGKENLFFGGETCWLSDRRAGRGAGGFPVLFAERCFLHLAVHDFKLALPPD